VKKVVLQQCKYREQPEQSTDQKSFSSQASQPAHYRDSRYGEGFISARVAEGVKYINFLYPMQPDDTTIEVIGHM
jgi:hypothetical protein